MSSAGIHRARIKIKERWSGKVVDIVASTLYDVVEKAHQKSSCLASYVLCGRRFVTDDVLLSRLSSQFAHDFSELKLNRYLDVRAAGQTFKSWRNGKAWKRDRFASQF